MTAPARAPEVAPEARLAAEDAGADLLARICGEIRARMETLRPAASEYAELRAALEAMESSNADPAPKTTRRNPNP
jgi:hypothetical protein